MTPAAPWRPLLDTHLSQNSTTTLTLTTIDHDNSNRPVPRARTCEFRGFWPNPSLHPSALDALHAQCGGPNPAVYESDMLSLTTDVRMAKAPQLEGTGHVVEAVFWMKDVMNQWRVRGTAYVLGDPAGGAHEEAAREEVRKGMRRTQGEEDGWTWERQVTSYFANHPPAMRGSFRNPPPGRPRDTTAEPGLGLGQTVDDLHDPVARGNFRVVVVRPEEVERLDLSDLQNVRRVQWTLKGDRWEEVELWP
ncbi:pyridoxamine 5'-phosphate oxidase-domain-containing protein [Aspergillus floccosus]